MWAKTVSSASILVNCQRIVFKIVLTTTYVYGRCPAYFNGACVSLGVIAGRARLRSADRYDLVTHCMRNVTKSLNHEASLVRKRCVVIFFSPAGIAISKPSPVRAWLCALRKLCDSVNL